LPVLFFTGKFIGPIETWQANLNRNEKVFWNYYSGNVGGDAFE